MINEFSAGAIIFTIENNEILYLLLDCKSRYDFVKGNIIKGETEKETAIREIEEETGIHDLKFIENFKEVIEHNYRWENDFFHKKITFFLAETKTRDVKISFEHFGYKWCDYNEAMRLLKFRNTRELLKKVHELLTGVVEKVSNK